MVGRCRLTVSKPILNPPVVSAPQALEAKTAELLLTVAVVFNLRRFATARRRPPPPTAPSAALSRTRPSTPTMSPAVGPRRWGGHTQPSHPIRPPAGLTPIPPNQSDRQLDTHPFLPPNQTASWTHTHRSQPVRPPAGHTPIPPTQSDRQLDTHPSLPTSKTATTQFTAPAMFCQTQVTRAIVWLPDRAL